MAAGTEVMGSRKAWEEGKKKYGQMLYVSDDNSTGKPVVGTTYFTPSGGSVESGVTGRICIKVEDLPEALAGLVMHVGTFAAFKAYA